MKTKLNLCFMLFMILASCSDHDVSPPNERAMARWMALIDGDWAGAYAFESPSYRSAYTVKEYRNNFGNSALWESISVASVDKVDEDTVDVILDLNSIYEDVPLLTQLSERWFFKAGEWWHVQNKL